MKVSVIVPVYNTGEYLEPCVESLLSQTIDEYEAIFVDDGSSDGTERRLDELAAAHARLRVIHRPASGGPGGPRNAGIDAARGDYVYFLDDDDWLGPEALERMHAMAVRNDSDIVIGRMVGHGRTVPRAMFRESRDRADVLDDALYGMLTPHKMFRRSFLREHRIRFPEGAVRLEDHRFVLTAYFKAGVISVLADYPCCHWVKRAGSYSRNRPDPVHFYEALREVLDIVDEHVPPGPARDRFHAHWYRGKILKRLGEKAVLDAPDDYRHAVYAEARGVAVERFGAGVDARLPLRMRVRSALLRDDARDDLFTLLEAERGITIESTLDDLVWDGDRLVVRFGARFVYRDGAPFAFDVGRWVPPVPLKVPDEVLDTTYDACAVELYVRRREDRSDLRLPARIRRTGDFAMSGEAVIDPHDAAALAAGVWDVVVRLDGGGWTLERRLPGDIGLGVRGRLAPYRTENGNLSVRVAAPPPPRGGLKRVLGRLPVARDVTRRLRA